MVSIFLTRRLRGRKDSRLHQGRKTFSTTVERLNVLAEERQWLERVVNVLILEQRFEPGIVWVVSRRFPPAVAAKALTPYWVTDLFRNSTFISYEFEIKVSLDH